MAIKGWVIWRVFDKENNFNVDLVHFVRSGFDRSTSSYGLLDTKFQITTYREEKRPGNELSYKRNVYVYNNAANEFTLILTEPNEEMIENSSIQLIPCQRKINSPAIM